MARSEPFSPDDGSRLNIKTGICEKMARAYYMWCDSCQRNICMTALGMVAAGSEGPVGNFSRKSRRARLCMKSL